jgi:hypothetical protein
MDLDSQIEDRKMRMGKASVRSTSFQSYSIINVRNVLSSLY